MLADRALAAFEAGVSNRAARSLRAPVASLDDVEAEAVVVTAGPWARQLLARAGIELQVVETRETVLYFRLERETPVPSTVTMVDNLHGFYSVYDPVYGLKVGHHSRGSRPIPTRKAGPTRRSSTRSPSGPAGRSRSPSRSRSSVQTCFYTNTADDSFVLERHGRIVVGSACSGHAFKFGPAVGDAPRRPRGAKRSA